MLKQSYLLAILCIRIQFIQFDRPETAIEYDIDPKQAVQTRLKQFANFAKNGQIIAAPHLPFPGIGHIYSADGKSYQWIPVHFKD